MSLLDRYLARAPAEVLAPFAREGIVKVRMWLRRPTGARGAGPDVDDDLFYGFMPMRLTPAAPPARTRRRARAGSARARPS